MSQKKQSALEPFRPSHDHFATLRRMAGELDRTFDQPFGFAFKWPSLHSVTFSEAASWLPRIDVFERDNHLITKADLPGLTKEDVRVEIADGCLAISGERRSELEEARDHVYRCERSYGSFYRAVPLPKGVKAEEVTATFSNGVLEVSVPLSTTVDTRTRMVPIQEPAPPATSAAA